MFRRHPDIYHREFRPLLPDHLDELGGVTGLPGDL
jgi:hypothetical protein